MTAASYTIVSPERPLHRYRRRRPGEVPAEASQAETIVGNELKRLRLRFVYEGRLFLFGDGTGFRPDFYLPDLDIAIEVTTMRRLNHKNRKLARFRDIYPWIPVILISWAELTALQANRFDLMATITDAINATQSKGERNCDVK